MRLRGRHPRIKVAVALALVAMAAHAAVRPMDLRVPAVSGMSESSRRSSAVDNSDELAIEGHGAPVTLTVAIGTTAAVEAVETAEGDAACPSGMALVDGDYCPALGQVCVHKLEGKVERCAEFDQHPQCVGKVQHKRYCIDRYEYPNQPGVKPAVMVTWEHAKATCEGEGKRLCTDSEWTLACEGEERLPYPYGYERNAEACNIDKELPVPDVAALADPKRAGEEAARLDQRVPSGSMAQCTSPYGVHDMTGNVDEWVVNEKHLAAAAAPSAGGDDAEHSYASGLKGGYWGPVRNRCRPMTTAHDEIFRYYQIGFRCCAGASGD